MIGIEQTIVFNILRLKGEFVDPIGNPKLFSGTGFWIRDDDRQYIVTNRHNLDPTIKFGDDTEMQLFGLEIELRKGTPELDFTKDTNFFSLDLSNSGHSGLKNTDVAIISTPTFADSIDGYVIPHGIEIRNIADEDYLCNKVQMMDRGSFIGYPGTRTSRWWDHEWNLPVARDFSVASIPKIPFTNSGIKTSETILVSGMSFSGSSGSPVLLHQKGIATGPEFNNPLFVERKLIGIMSGHWWEDEHATPEMFRHSGMSYFTRSTSILDLLDQIRQARQIL